MDISKLTPEQAKAKLLIDRIYIAIDNAIKVFDILDTHDRELLAALIFEAERSNFPQLDSGADLSQACHTSYDELNKLIDKRYDK